MTEQKTTVTLKAAGGHDAPWLVFNGTPDEIKQQIITAFGFGGHEASELNMVEIVLQANQSFQNQYVVSRDLGGRVIGHERVSKGAPSEGAAEAPAESSEPQEDPLVAEIKAADNFEALTRIWKRNQQAFKDRPELGEIVKTRRAELTA